MKRIFTCTFLALLLLLSPQIALAVSDVKIVDKDIYLRSLTNKINFNWYEFEPGEDKNIYDPDASGVFGWNSSSSYPTSLADLPAEDIFKDLLADEEGAVTVNIHLRPYLDFDKANKNWLNYLTNDKTFPTVMKWVNISTISRDRGISISNQATRAEDEELGGSELQYTEQVIAVGNLGQVQVFDKITLTYNKNTKGWGVKADTQTGEGVEWVLDEWFPVSLYLVSYEFTTHDITIIQADNGKISPNPAEDDGYETTGVIAAREGKDQSFTILPNDGYQIAHLLIDGKEEAPNNQLLATYTFSDVREEHTIGAVFEPYIGTDASAASGLTVSVTGLASSAESSVVTEFESLGFANGSKAVNIADGSESTSGGTFKAEEFVQAVTVNISVESAGAGDGAVTLSVPLNGGSSSAGKSAYAMSTLSSEKGYYTIVLNRSTNFYDLWPMELDADNNRLTAEISPASAYAPEATFFIYSGTATVTSDSPTAAETGGGGSSSSGCNAGLCALALMLPAYLIISRKRRN